MTTEQIIGLILALLIMCVGTLGSILPAIPSTPLVMLVAIVHRLYFGDLGPNNLVLVILGLLTLVSLGLDYLATMIGAKQLGATWRGVLGAVLGGVIGIFAGPAGIILGPFLGALLLEMAGGREWQEAARAGVGAVLGLLIGAIGKLACCVAMTGLFAVNVIMRSLDPPVAQAAAGLVNGPGG